jgi:chromosome partitioning protein
VAGLTLAQLFEDKVSPMQPPKFDIEKAIIKGVSQIDGGIARLDLLPSSIEFIDIQEKLPFIAMQGNYEHNPQDILRKALQPVIERYSFVIIDCPLRIPGQIGRDSDFSRTAFQSISDAVPI